jgi:hypothetical protein
LSVAGRRPLDGRNVRIGLGTLATGLLAIRGDRSAPDTSAWTTESGR